MDNMTVSVLTMQWMDNARLVSGMQWNGQVAGLGGWVADWATQNSVFILFGVMGERARPNITNSLYLNPTPPDISVADI